MRVTPLIAALCLLSPSSLAQDAPADTLRGPSVNQRELETIGTTDMSGNFIPVEGRPELAAFALICDDPDDRARAREIATDHVFDLAGVLVDEIDTLREMTDARTNGDNERARELSTKLRLSHDPDTLRDPLRAELARLLDDAQRERFGRVLDDYWRRWVSANTPESAQNMKGEPRTEAIYTRIEEQLNTRLYQRDLAQAYEYSIRRYHDALQGIYDAIDPTEEQRAWIRARIIRHIKDTRLRATIEQREGVMLEIYHMLDEDRQAKLFAYMARTAIQRN